MIVVQVENDSTAEERREAAAAVDLPEDADELERMISRAWAQCY